MRLPWHKKKPMHLAKASIKPMPGASLKQMKKEMRQHFDCTEEQFEEWKDLFIYRIGTTNDVWVILILREGFSTNELKYIGVRTASEVLIDNVYPVNDKNGDIVWAYEYEMGLQLNHCRNSGYPCIGKVDEVLDNVVDTKQRRSEVASGEEVCETAL